jgi:hypothetical protein
MMEKGIDKKPGHRGNGMYTALATHKISRKEKFAWVAAGLSILVLLLAWWARSSQ